MGLISFGLTIVSLAFSIVPLLHYVSGGLAIVSIIFAIVSIKRRLEENRNNALPIIVIIVDLLILVISTIMYEGYDGTLNPLTKINNESYPDIIQDQISDYLKNIED